MKKKLISLTLAITALVAGCGTTAKNKAETSVAETVTTKTTVIETATDTANKKENMKQEYNLSDPMSINDDTTGKWRLNRMTGTTNPIDFAFDYYKNFMQPDEIHYIINFSTKTTTIIQNMAGMLYVRVLEHVDKEEVTAKTIGSGTVLQEKYFNIETGEPYEVEVSSDIATVSSEELVAKVTEMLPDNMTEGAELKNVTVREDKDLFIEVDLTHANDNSNIKLPLDVVAETSVSQITDPILDLGDEYYNAWNTITLDFGDYGHVTFSKSDVTASAAGKYFSYEGDVLQK
jgi:lipoprotein|nr:MAG TPA: outer membrane protein assembly factor [Caudoviricetes sp.]